MELYLNVVNCLIRFAYWLCVAPLSSFASAVLLGKGYMNTEIGIIMGTASIIAIFLQSILASYCDSHQEFSTIKLCFYLVFIMFPIYGLLFFFISKSVVITVAYTCLFTLCSCLSPFVNNFSHKLAQAGHHVSLPAALIVGAVGYSIVTYVVGQLSAFGNQALMITTMVGIATFALVLFYADGVLQKVLKGITLEKQPAKMEAVSYGEFLKHNALFLLAVIGITLCSFVDTILYAFPLQIVSSVGGNSASMGTFLSISSFMQMPGLFAFPKLEKKFSLANLLCVASVTYVIKAFIMYNATSMTMLYVSVLTRMINYPFLNAALIPFVNQVMPKNEANRGQTIYTMCALVLSIISSFAGGYMIDNIGVKNLLFMALISTIVGMFVFIPSIKAVERKHNEKIVQ